MMNPIQPPDSHHLLAASGWLELGVVHEANEELERITPALHSHPDVLNVRWEICAAAKKWEACIDTATALTKIAPDSPAGWIHLSFALHELKRTQEAWDNLRAVASRFEKNSLVSYNLACYASQLGDLPQARALLKRAVELDPHPPHMKLMSLDDPDLQPLRANS